MSARQLSRKVRMTTNTEEPTKPVHVRVKQSSASPGSPTTPNKTSISCQTSFKRHRRSGTEILTDSGDNKIKKIIFNDDCNLRSGKVIALSRVTPQNSLSPKNCQKNAEAFVSVMSMAKSLKGKGNIDDARPNPYIPIRKMSENWTSIESKDGLLTVLQLQKATMALQVETEIEQSVDDKTNIVIQKSAEAGKSVEGEQSTGNEKEDDSVYRSEKLVPQEQLSCQGSKVNKLMPERADVQLTCFENLFSIELPGDVELDRNCLNTPSNRVDVSGVMSGVAPSVGKKTLNNTVVNTTNDATLVEQDMDRLEVNTRVVMKACNKSVAEAISARKIRIPIDKSVIARNRAKSVVGEAIDEPVVSQTRYEPESHKTNNLVATQNIENQISVNTSDMPVVATNMDKPVVAEKFDKLGVVTRTNNDRPKVIGIIHKSPVVESSEISMVSTTIERPEVGKSIGESDVAVISDKLAVVNTSEIQMIPKQVVTKTIDKQIIAKTVDKPFTIKTVGKPAVTNTIARPVGINMNETLDTAKTIAKSVVNSNAFNEDKTSDRVIPHNVKLIKVATGTVHINARTNKVAGGFINLGNFRDCDDNKIETIGDSTNDSLIDENECYVVMEPVTKKNGVSKTLDSDSVKETEKDTKEQGLRQTNEMETCVSDSELCESSGTSAIPTLPSTSLHNSATLEIASDSTFSEKSSSTSISPNQDFASTSQSSYGKSLMLFDVSKTSNELLHVDKENFVCGTVCKSVFVPPGSTEVYRLDTCTYYCNYCLFRSMDRQDFITHVIKHRFHCKICKFQSFSRCKVIAHALEAHDSFPNEFDNVQYCALVQDYTLAVEMNKSNTSKRKTSETLSECKANKITASSPDTKLKTPTASSPENKPPQKSCKSTVVSPIIPKSDPTEILVEFITINDDVVITGKRDKTLNDKQIMRVKRKRLQEQKQGSKRLKAKKQDIEEILQERAAAPMLNPNESVLEKKVKKSDSLGFNTVGLSCQVCNFLTLCDDVFTIHAREAHPEHSLRPIHIVVSRTVSLQIANLDAVRETEVRHNRFDWALANVVRSDSDIKSIRNLAFSPSIDTFPKTYQCQNCYGQLLDLTHMKDHLMKQHEGEIFAVKNMRMNAKKVEWFVLCPIGGCYKYFVDSQSFIDHTNNCSALCKSSHEKMVLDRKAINVTLQFAFSAGSKCTYNLASHLLYQCKYCNVRCSSNSMKSIMEHVTTWHSRQVPVFINRKRFNNNFGKVFFCQKCRMCFSSLAFQEAHAGNCRGVVTDPDTSVDISSETVPGKRAGKVTEDGEVNEIHDCDETESDLSEQIDVEAT